MRPPAHHAESCTLARTGHDYPTSGFCAWRAPSPATALRPGGVVAIWVRQDRACKIRQIGGLLDLFFGFFSEAGTWAAAEVAGWCREAGLEAQKPRSPRMMPDLALHIGRKPA